MRRLASLSGLLFLAGLLTPAPDDLGAAPAPGPGPGELQRLHVLLVFDTASNLEEGLKVDRDNVRSLLARNIPPKMVTVQVLEGKKATRDNILSYYKELKVGKDEGLLCYHGGHGGTLGNRHFLALPGGKLFRDDLVKAMEAKGAGLTVLLTDTNSQAGDAGWLRREGGSEEEPVRKAPERKDGTPPRVPTPAFQSLFFRAWGTVDITAATNDKAYGDDEKGGLFTRAFCRSLEYRSPNDTKKALPREVLQRLDANGDGVLTWREYFAALRADTTGLFKAWSEDLVEDQPELNEARPQTPQAFKLGRPHSPRDVLDRLRGVVTLANETDKPIRLAYRWPGRTGWETIVLPPSGTRTLTTSLKQHDDPLPVCEVQRAGSPELDRLRPGLWEGNEDPPATAGMRYSFKQRKE